MRRALAAALLVLCVCAPEAAAQREDVALAGGFSAPTAMALAPDGRVFVAEQGGELRVLKNGALLAAPFVDLAVSATNERGLLGVELHPAFASNRYVYVYYTRASSPVVNRLSRFTASASNPDVAEAGSETVIMDNIPSQSGYHNGGAIHFGPDGRLYVAVGEGHTGSNAQSLSTLAGKLLRIDPDGGIPSDNPFYGSTSGVNRAIWARGFRNPFTFDVQHATGRIFVNDVGQNAYEEINEAWSGPNNGSNAGFNFGWPETEGPTSRPEYRTPFHFYAQGGAECAITGGAFYDPATVNFPSHYAGDYFFADFCAGWIKSIDLATKQVSDFIAADASRGPVDIKVAEDGSLFYLARGSGRPSQLRRVRYVGAGEAPSVTAQPQDRTVTVGASATFTVSAGGSQPLAYQWQRGGVDIPGATAASYTVTGAQPGDDGARFRAVVRNAAGSATSDEATLHVTADQPPSAAIVSPAAGERYSAGQTIGYAGSATDPEGGPVTYTWRVDFHHEAHSHPFLPATQGGAAGSFTVPAQGETSADVWYRLHLTVTDQAGLTASAQRDVLPRTATIRLASNVAGARLDLDGSPTGAPYATTGVVGVERELTAPSPQTVGGRTYEFVSWSDGGARRHTISTPASETTYTATFRDTTGGAPAGAPSGAAGALLPAIGPPLPAALRLVVRSPARMTWAGARRRGVPVRVRGVPGATVRAVVRLGRRTLGARAVRVGTAGERLIRIRVRTRRRAGTDRRRRAQLVVSAVMPDGRAVRATRRLVLVTRHEPGGR